MENFEDDCCECDVDVEDIDNADDGDNDVTDNNNGGLVMMMMTVSEQVNYSYNTADQLPRTNIINIISQPNMHFSLIKL